MYDLAQLLCAFISPKSAQNLFTKPESTENTGFIDDLKKLDPNFDPKVYSDFIDEPAGPPKE